MWCPFAAAIMGRSISFCELVEWFFGQSLARLKYDSCRMFISPRLYTLPLPA